MKTPWHSKEGKIQFPYRAILDRVFVYPDLLPERYESKENLIEIPTQFREFYQEGVGTVLSIGPGYQDDNGKWHYILNQLKPGVHIRFDKTVPWRVNVKGLDGKEYSVVICGYSDVYGVIE